VRFLARLPITVPSADRRTSHAIAGALATRIMNTPGPTDLSSGFVLAAGICRFAGSGPAFADTSLEAGEPVSGRGR